MPETDSYAARHLKWIVGERLFYDQTPKSMKKLITNFALDILRKSDLPRLMSLVGGQFNLLFSRIKFKKILSLKSLIVLGFVVAVMPLFFAVMYADFGIGQNHKFAGLRANQNHTPGFTKDCRY